MENFEKRLGYTFKNINILQDALTHSSYANEHKGDSVSNERLEFLGDAVLGLIIARYFYLSHPEFPEGSMTRYRAELVCEKNLDRVAAKLCIGDFVRFGKGERTGGGKTRPSILADAVEAVLASVYLDGGMSAAEDFVDRFIIKPYEAGEMRFGADFKTELQELVQRKSGQTLEYELVGEKGPDHAKTFEVEVRLNGKTVGRGQGHNKKDAEQSAAQAALETLK